MYIVIPEEIKAKSYKEARAKLRELKSIGLTGYIHSIREDEYIVFVDTISQQTSDYRDAAALYEAFRKLGVNSKIKRLSADMKKRLTRGVRKYAW